MFLVRLILKSIMMSLVSLVVSTLVIGIVLVVGYCYADYWLDNNVPTLTVNNWRMEIQFRQKQPQEEFNIVNIFKRQVNKLNKSLQQEDSI